MEQEKLILSLQDIIRIMPFEKSKIYQLIKADVLPVVKIGRDYITTAELLNEWIKANIGKEIYY